MHMKKLSIGIIGMGQMGLRHLQYVNKMPDMEVTCIADPMEANVVSFSGSGVQGFTDYLQLLDEGQPDGVIIAAPNAHHVAIARECIVRGIAVLIEKPISDSLRSAKELTDFVSKSAAPVLVGHHRRYHPILQAARAYIEEGGIGNQVAVTAQWMRRKPSAYFQDLWKTDPGKGGGVLLINAIHDIDCLRMLFGNIVAVQAMTSSRTRELAVEDTAAVNFQFASGALGSLVVSDAALAPWSWEATSGEDERYALLPLDCYHLSGTRGSLAVPSLETWTNEPEADREHPMTRRRLPRDSYSSFLKQLNHFADVIQRKAAPQVTAESALETLAVVQAVGISANTNRTVFIRDLVA